MRARLVPLFYVFAGQVAFATTYMMPDDYRVVCLDLGSGKEIWSTENLELPNAPIFVGPSHVTVVDKTITKDGKLQGLYVLDADAVAPLDPLKSPTDPVLFAPDSSRELIIDDGVPRIVARFPEFMKQLVVRGPVAFITFGMGEVFAFDYRAAAVTWEHRTFRVRSSSSRLEHTDLVLDGSRLLLVHDQYLTGLDAVSGRVLFDVRLSSQTLRPWDSPWAVVRAHDDVLIISVYDHLVALDRNTGQRRWSRDLGALSGPHSITVAEGRLYALERSSNRLGVLSHTNPPQLAPATPDILRVSRDGVEWKLEPLFRFELDKDVDIVGPIYPPIPATNSAELRIFDYDAKEPGRVPLMLDAQYVALGRFTNWVQVVVDGKVVREAEILKVLVAR